MPVQERGRVRAVERAVVPGEHEQPDVVDGDRVVAVGTVDHHRRFLMPSVERIATCGWLMIGSVA